MHLSPLIGLVGIVGKLANEAIVKAQRGKRSVFVRRQLAGLMCRGQGRCRHVCGYLYIDAVAVLSVPSLWCRGVCQAEGVHRPAG